MLNKSKGNMYGFVTHTWNPIKGKCPHECSYCYMKRFPQGELRLDEKCFKDNLGKGNFIFVGSSTDMFANNIDFEWICDVLAHCRKFTDNKYLFQSKNPKRFYNYNFLVNPIFATTLETNREKYIFEYAGNVPQICDRVDGIRLITDTYEKMITIEPIMDFDLIKFHELIYEIKPFQVNIGADSGHNNLPEPPKEKIEALITELKKFTKVYLKDNLGRLLE